MTPKDATIRQVIEKRVSIIKEAVKHCQDEKDRSWYEGRIQGLMDVHDLLGETLESIEIELL